MNTPGCARCQCSKADPVTTFNIFRIVVYGATRLKPWAAKLSTACVTQVCFLLPLGWWRQRQGGCDKPMLCMQVPLAVSVAAARA